ncbi:MAG TPA: hypothetical protein VG733_08090 [Chthoniobacteraceae bacterium]|nr:hypothetical protein [Chthoniobacteraceae bacterium]
MMKCIPQSLFSWDFSVLGGAAGGAQLNFNFFTEQGSIRYGADEYEVRKHGAFSGEWTMENGAGTYARAVKPNPFTRVFNIQEPGGAFQLKAVPLMRSFDILHNGAEIGSIAPEHFLTRASTIDCGPQLSEPGQLFCFWLAALMWRRAARNSSSASTST